MLQKLGFVNKDGNISITNIVVFIFVAITAFRSLLSGLVIEGPWLSFKIDSMDVSSTLPMLFSLINYSHKRMVLNPKKKEPSNE